MPDYFISREKAESGLLLCAAFLAERIESGDGHAEAMGEIVPRLLESGEVDLAAELSNAVVDPYSRDRLLMVVAEKCAEVNDDEYALQLADAVEDEGLQAQALERIAIMQAARGDVAKAAEVAARMSHPDFVYAAIAARQATGGDEAAANATIDTIDFAPARVSALREIADSKLDGGDERGASTWLDRAADVAAKVEHAEERVGLMCEIGNRFVDAKRNDRAVETFAAARVLGEQIDNTHRDRLLATCALGFLRTGSTELAERTLDLVNDKTQMASALVGFARDHWKREEKDEAVDALDEASEILSSQRETETRDSGTRNSVMAAIAVQFGAFGKFARGIEIAQTNNDQAKSSAALTQIARLQTAANEPDGAYQTVNMIESDTDRITAFVALADIEASDGDAVRSLELLDRAATGARTLPQPTSRAEALIEIGRRFAEQSKAEESGGLVDECLRAIVEIRDESSQAALLASLATTVGSTIEPMSESQLDLLRPLISRTGW
ncbi:MAG: hypothetical protein WKF34_10045 [Pyrinomonadaceae bacterium]